MEYFSTIWFEASLLVVLFLFVLGIVGYFVLSKERMDSLPDKEKSQMRAVLPKAVLLYKLSLILLPVFIFVLPSIYKLDIGLASAIVFGLTLMYTAEFVSFFLIKRILGNLGE
jgi:hypothetical protein